MTTVFGTIRQAVSERFRLWLGITVGFVIVYYVGMMIGLIVRFGSFPNYVEFYDWFGNVDRIIRSTPAVQDMLPIILEEWLVEIGYMNTDFGMGISEWSLTIIPPKIILSLVLGALMATALVLLMRRRACSATTLNSAGGAAGIGSALVALSNLTMSWVVCCATPSWVVGLAMMGLGVSTSLALEPYGFWLNAGGFLLLGGSVIWIAAAQTTRDAHHKAARAKAVPAR
ncbi:MAG: hypothetical protein AAGF14_00910 [Pseudomonadota bacterium]